MRELHAPRSVPFQISRTRKACACAGANDDTPKVTLQENPVNEPQNPVPSAARQPPLELICPSCRVLLVMSERQKIEIDYCPQCRGVWLERGELDKIIERSTSHERSAARQISEPDEEEQGRGVLRGGGHHGRAHGRGYRRRTWLQKLFE